MSATESRLDYDHVTRIGKAIGHPVRSRILQCLDDKRAGLLAGASITSLDRKTFGMSPNEVAGLTDEALPNVAYHFRILLNLGAVVGVHLRPVRGAVEHFYMLTDLGSEAARIATRVGRREAA